MRHFLCYLLCCFLSVTALAGDKAPVQVLLETSEGNIILELNAVAAPISTNNFLQYIDSGFYKNTLFHRVIPDFMIQGGGFEAGMREKPTQAAIRNESANGLHNVRGSIAMARTAQPDSATAQFFINLVDNAYLDGSAAQPGYAVFGKVVSGMDVIDRIAAARTQQQGVHQNVPAKDVLIRDARRLPPAAPPTTLPAP